MPRAGARSKSKSKSKCGKGYIKRKAYTRKTGSKTVKVSSKCIRSTSQSGKKTTTEFKKYQKKQTRSHELARKKYPKAASKKCSKGQIKREGYVRKTYIRKAYTRKDGTRVKASKVTRKVIAPKCVKDTGKKGHGKQMFKLEKGALGQYGYDNLKNLTKIQRHRALNKALREGYKPLPLFRKLNALYVVNMNKNKKLASIFKEDSEYVKTTRAYQNRPTAKKTKTKPKTKSKSKGKRKTRSKSKGRK